MTLNWQECKKHLHQVRPDQNKVKSLQKMCSVRQRMIAAIPIDEETASLLVADYYEIMKELLTALLLQQGFKSANHECLITFFEHTHSSYVYEIKMLRQLKDIRNRVLYDGLFVRKEYLIRNQLEFNHLIKLLHHHLG